MAEKLLREFKFFDQQSDLGPAGVKVSAPSRSRADAGKLSAEVDVQVVVHDVIDFADHNLKFSYITID